MNKEKVMQAVYEMADLQSICDKDIREKAINKVQKELYSKPVMPPAFDEWKKQHLNNRCELLYWIAELESGGEESKQDNDLSDWLFENGIDDTFFHRYQMCIEAILYGYEVEK